MSNDPDLKDKHQREFTKILSSGVDSSLCKGLMEAVATAHQVLWASGDTSLLVDFYRYSRTMATSFPGIDVGRLPNPSNNVGDSLFFATKDDTSTKYAMAPYRWRELIKRARFGKVHFWTLP
jgi:hypothetical protein